jgi:glycosyltransferase involved in cell wall biosynthesis
MAKICIIDNDAENMMPPFLQNGFEQLGHETVAVFASTPEPELRRQIEESGSDLIVGIQNVAFRCGELLCSGSLSKIKKAVLCYDDPVNSYYLFGKKHPFIASPRENNVHFFVWDGYWRKKMESLVGWKCHPTHLAAERKYFSPDKPPRYSELSQDIVFLGNIPSMDSLGKIQSQLPKEHLKAAMQLWQSIMTGSYGTNPFEALDQIIANRPEAERNVILNGMEAAMNERFEVGQPLPAHVQLRRLAWQMGKRETRLRAMVAASKVVPLAILSDFNSYGAAGKDELLQEIQKRGGKECRVIDTSGITYYELGFIYTSGLAHLQSTDPQSVEGGIPYRVFQSAACAAPLISDAKPELEDCFVPEKEIILYQNDADLGEVLQRAISDPEKLNELGKAANARFSKDHSWAHRMKEVLGVVGSP